MTVKTLFTHLKWGVLVPIGGFLPERIILVLFLLILLLLLLNVINGRGRRQETCASFDNDYQLAKTRWRREFFRSRDKSKLAPVAGIDEDDSARAGLTNKALKPNGKIIKVIDKNRQGRKAYQFAKLRWRNEISDQLFEKRIQSVFERIRESDPAEYQKGIEEIRTLLYMRKNSLKTSPVDLNSSNRST